MMRGLHGLLWTAALGCGAAWILSLWGVGFIGSSNRVFILIDRGEFILATPHAAGYLSGQSGWQIGGDLGDHRWMMGFFDNVGVWNTRWSLLSAVGMAACCLVVVHSPSRITRWRRRARRLRGQCVRCGYDLTGLPRPRCPECGAEPLHTERIPS